MGDGTFRHLSGKKAAWRQLVVVFVGVALTNTFLIKFNYLKVGACEQPLELYPAQASVELFTSLQQPDL